MGVIVLPTTFADNTIPTAAQFNGDFNTIYSEFNGNITNANISASAAIAASKLDGVATLTGAETFTNKRITKRVQAVTDSATPTPDADSYDVYTLTALAQAAAFAAPSGTPTSGQGLVIRIKDNGTARALTFNAIYRFSSDLAAPTTTVLSKTMYLGFIYNSADAKWDCVALINNF